MTNETKMTNFITEIIDNDLASGRYESVHTRFPPEPNGYLHLGHAKAVLLNYMLAKQYNGKFNLRFDDTNPVKEDQTYIDAIKRDIKWLGADWEDREFYASDYFDQLYEWAIQMIKQGDAFVCDLNAEQIREYRGSLTVPGKESPYRNRSIEENLDLFERMKNGEFEDGTRTLRAKVDMSSPNLNMRDPVMYRIMHATHHRTGDKWCIYPMYDWTHGQSDSIEGITHSNCSLEFEDHRPLYNWYVEKLGIFAPRQTEFARLNITYAVMSKRKIIRLVNEGFVSGWDDPRLITISGMRRRGYRPEAIQAFTETIGVAKANSIIDFALLEHTVRTDLDQIVPRVMAVLDPVKLIIDNFPDDEVIEFDVDFYRHDDSTNQTRKVPLTKELYIEREDFMIDPPKKFFRLAPGKEVRLMSACLVTCTDYKIDDDGNVTEIHCTYDPESLGGMAPDGRKVKGTIHWVSAKFGAKAKVNLYDKLFNDEYPESEGDFIENINEESLIVLEEALIEPSLLSAKEYERFQFVRKGFFSVDPVESKDGAPVFNRVVSLRDSWAKMQKK